jgi:hypothetical protein
MHFSKAYTPIYFQLHLQARSLEITFSPSGLSYPSIHLHIITPKLWDLFKLKICKVNIHYVTHIDIE